MCRDNWKTIGYCDVDAGCLMLVDPCYVLQSDSTTVTYDEFLHEAEKEGYFDKNNHLAFHGGVIVGSGWGDGHYPVKVQRNAHGRIMAVMVDFDPQDEDCE